MRSILLSSLAFSVLALAVLAFRRFRSENYSRRLARALWIVVVLRMVIPFTLSDGLAVVRLPLNQVTEKLFQAEPSLPAQPAPADNGLGFVNPADEVHPPQNLPEFEAPMLPQAPAEPIVAEPVAQSPLPAVEGENPVPTPAPWQKWSAEKILMTVYGLGVGFSLGILGLSYLKFRSAMKRKLKSIHHETEEAILALIGRDVRLFTIEHDESPMTMGIFKPWLILPARLLPSQAEPRALSKQLQFVLRHEYAHIRKRDLWLKTLYLLGRAIQWFNPLAYLIQEPLNEDIELATDEEVAHTMPRHERAAYCRSILEVAEALPTTANNYSSRFTGDVKSMKKRISTLFKEGKTKRGITVMLLLLLAATLTIGVVSCELEVGRITDELPGPIQTEAPFDPPTDKDGRLLLYPTGSCQDYFMTVGTEFEIEFDNRIYPSYGPFVPSEYDTSGPIHRLGIIELSEQNTFRDQYLAVKPGDFSVIRSKKACFFFWVLTEEEAKEKGVASGVVVPAEALPPLEKDYSNFSAKEILREFYDLMNDGKFDQAYQLTVNGAYFTSSPLQFIRNNENTRVQTEILSLLSKAEYYREVGLEKTNDLGDVPGICERLMVETRDTGIGAAFDGAVSLSEVTLSKVNDILTIVNIGLPTCCGCNEFHGEVQQSSLVRTSTVGALTLYQYDLKPIRVDSLTFTPLLHDQLPINAAAGSELRIQREKVTIGGAEYFARHISTAGSPSRVVVEKDGELVFTALDTGSEGQDLGIVSGVRGGIKLFTKVDESWLLEVAREKAEETGDGEAMLKASGYLYLDGESINEKYGYDSAFNFQILAGKPFFFFEREGKTGFSYNWEEFDLPFETIIHYACCSAGLNNPREFENLVAFVVSDGAVMTYYELVNLNLQIEEPLRLAAPIRVEKNGIVIEVQKVEQDQDRITLTVKYQLKDWRGWGLSNVKLLIGDKYYQYPSQKLIEQRIQKLEDQVCLSNHWTGETCEEGSSEDLYRIEELTFSGVPGVLDGQKLRLEIWRYSVDPPEGARYCDVMRAEYIQDQLAKKYPGLVLNCIVGPGRNGIDFTEGTPFSDNPEARNELNFWMKQALAEAIVGPWEFDIVD